MTYVTDKLNRFLRYKSEMVTIFEELVDQIVDSRLRLKSFGKAAPILEKDESMESVYIVIKGRIAVVDSSTGNRICHYEKDDVVASGCLGVQTLSMIEDLDLSSKNLNRYFGKKVRLISGDSEDYDSNDLYGTDLLCIDMIDIKSIFYSVRERVSKAQYATITSSKIKWFSLLDPDRVIEFRSQLSQLRFLKGEIIYDIGESTEHFYFLHEGKVRMDSMFELEHITKWPSAMDQTEWNLHSKKVIRSLNESSAPDIIGHIDALNAATSRIIRAVAITDVIVLQGHTRLLFEYLTHQQMKAMGNSVQDKNPQDIGRVFLSNRYDT